MGIDVTNSQSSEVASENELQHFILLGFYRLWQPAEGAEHSFWISQSAESQLTDHERMCQH